VTQTSCCFGQSVLMLCEKFANNTTIVLKKYNVDRISSEELDYLKNEIVTIRQISHPNLMRLLQSIVEREFLTLGLPYMCFGSCKDVIDKFFNHGFPEVFIALIIKDVLSGLDYLHKQGYIHRSVCAKHIFLNRSCAVLGGLRDCRARMFSDKSSKLHNIASSNDSSLKWYAPEVLEQNLLGYDEKSDIYSVGLTCCELARGIEPYLDFPPTLMLTEKVKDLEKDSFCKKPDYFSISEDFF